MSDGHERYTAFASRPTSRVDIDEAVGGQMRTKCQNQIGEVCELLIEPKVCEGSNRIGVSTVAISCDESKCADRVRSVADKISYESKKDRLKIGPDETTGVVGLIVTINGSSSNTKKGFIRPELLKAYDDVVDRCKELQEDGVCGLVMGTSNVGKSVKIAPACGKNAETCYSICKSLADASKQALRAGSSLE